MLKFYWIAALAGILQAQAPDHWMPVSVMAWQRSWSRARVVFFSLALSFSQVFFGWLLFRALRPGMNAVSHSTLVGLCALSLFAIGVVRMVRLGQVIDILKNTQRLASSIGIAFSLAGPAEFLVPLLWKSEVWGLSRALVGVCFLCGCAAASALRISLASEHWFQPWQLAQALRIKNRVLETAPAAAALALAAVLILVQE